MRSVRPWVVWAALPVAMLVPQAASAGPKEEARKHFDRAVELVDDGQLEEALIEFQRSYDLTQHFAVLYNIGQVLVSLAKPVEAVDAYERYLVEGGKQVRAARRAEVEEEITRQKARIATLEIRGLPEGAVVRVDDKEIGTAPIAAPVRVGVGIRTVAASAEGYDSAEAVVTVAGEDHKVVELVLVKQVVAETPPVAPVENPVEPAPAPPVLTPVPAPSPEAALSTTSEPAKARPLGKLRIAGIATAAAGAVGLATGTYCWLTAKSRHDQAVATWYEGSKDTASDLQGEAQDYVKAANISYVAGGVLVAAGLVLFVVGTLSTEGGTTASHAHVAPMVGPGFAGLTARGTWQ